MAFVENYPASSQVVDYKYDLYYEIIVNMRKESIQWFTEALQAIPLDLLNEGEKQSFLNHLQNEEIGSTDQYFKNFFNKYVKRCRKRGIRLD